MWLTLKHCMSHKIQFVRFSAINKNNSAMVKCVFCLKLYLAIYNYKFKERLCRCQKILSSYSWGSRLKIWLKPRVEWNVCDVSAQKALWYKLLIITNYKNYINYISYWRVYFLITNFPNTTSLTIKTYKIMWLLISHIFHFSFIYLWNWTTNFEFHKIKIIGLRS